MSDAQDDDRFLAMLAELSDGHKWQLLRAEGWEAFAERLSGMIVDLPPRRRQALVMLLFALTEGVVSSAELEAWAAGRDLDRDDGVEQLIAWLRSRPQPG